MVNNLTKTGQSPPIPAPAKKNIGRSSSPSGKSFTCNLNCSFNKPTDFCPYSTPKLTINTFMETMDTKSISSDNIISSQVISPTSTTQNPFHNITLNVTLNVAHAVSNVPLNLARYTDDLITDANTNTNEQDSSDIDV
ncbi:5218_t:CDS:2 [Entrophospora sp. SA101]|nr:5218_t:CDS:2 [Entrophospora sp. SA101]